MGDGKSFWLGVAAGAAVGVGLGYAAQRAFATPCRAPEGAHNKTCFAQLPIMIVTGTMLSRTHALRCASTGHDSNASWAQLSHPEAQDGAKVGFSLEDEILAEHFTRNVQFFGREGQQRIMGSFVVVIGLGVRPSLQIGGLSETPGCACIIANEARSDCQTWTKYSHTLQRMLSTSRGQSAGPPLHVLRATA